MPVSVKARMRFSSAQRRNQWVSAVQTAADALAAAAKLTSGYPARCETAAQASYGTNAAMAKYHFVSEVDAITLFDLMVTTALTRGPQAGSVIRITGDDGTVTQKREW
jgi:hypothetical protein